MERAAYELAEDFAADGIIHEKLAFAGEWPAKPLGVDLVFRTPVGTARDPSNVSHRLSSLTQEAGLGHWHPHELRHSAASLLIAEGVPLKMVSEMLGHSSITVTADVYSHVLAPAKTMSQQRWIERSTVAETVVPR